ncbi:hypothetical protein SAMN04487895_101497 [Paenibacillus sophorae]|uniref:Uncharacterized protein n=1 Tax=Paenibacillus sophorae TaxID=1333845 RepID=A0A1H8GFH1_9BACL|nr:hypothetical protein [Paenibacillus sophorae]QWU14208.1 hypothetical protein KP014_20055 [Paenibacillus sophorae]SEN42776.1 hypothetical protein SAMN04487895_101497 [Paenibacillus sophorae]
MNSALYTKDGKLRSRSPYKYIDRITKEPIPNSKLQKVKFPGITFLVGPDGGSIDENPDYTEWMRLKEEENVRIIESRLKSKQGGNV